MFYFDVAKWTSVKLIIFLALHVIESLLHKEESLLIFSAKSWFALAKSLFHKQRVKLINNRWAWGRCLERWCGLEHRSRARRVTMTTLWAATTRHRHTDKRQWNHDTYHILTGKRGREGRGVKSPSTVEKAKVHVQMSWPQNPSCKTTRPSADPPPLHMTETRKTPDQHCFAFNLA